MKTAITLTLLVLLVIIVAPISGKFAANNLSPCFQVIDPDRKYIWGIIHHVVQAIIPLTIMIFWNNKSLKDWGFVIGNKRLGLQFTGWFTLIWILLYLVITLVNIAYQNSPEVYYDVTNTRNLLGELVFRGLIVGPSEEILFRSFPIIIMITAGFNHINKIFGFKITHAGVISAFLFAMAHISMSLFPFEVYYFDPVQVITAMGLGILYAIVFHNTKSIIYPMAIHSISDIVPVLSLYFIHLFV